MKVETNNDDLDLDRFNNLFTNVLREDIDADKVLKSKSIYIV